MAWFDELANEFKSRDNKSQLGAVTGTVIQVSPLRISILGGDIILNEDKLYICSSIKNRYELKANIKLDNIPEHGAVSTSGTITLNDVLKINDIVVCLPADGGQTFFIIDKVG